VSSMGANAVKGSDSVRDAPTRDKSKGTNIGEASVGLGQDDDPPSPTRSMNQVKSLMKVEEEYQVKIDTEKGRLGLELTPDSDGLWVERVPFGLVFEWNRKHPAKAVKPGMLIVEVNDESDPAEMMSEIKQALILNLVVQKVKRGRAKAQGPRQSGHSSQHPLGRNSGMSSLSLTSSAISSVGSLSAPSFLAARPRQLPQCMHRITPENVRTILQIAGASPDQLMFYDDVASGILVSAMLGNPPRRLMVSSSMRTLELSVEGSADILGGLLRSFLNKGGVPPKMMEELELARDELKAEVGIVWVRFKHMGQSKHHAASHRAPEVDMGMSLLAQIDWMIADLLMPSLTIQDAIHEYAAAELSSPCAYSCSVFPNEAERSLLYLATKEWLPAKSLQSSLLCLRAAGFLKPPGTALKMLAACDPLSYGVQVCMGPRGVTRGVLHVGEVARANVADIAEALQCDLSPSLPEVNKVLGIGEQSLDFLDLEVSKYGWGVTCGYGCPWSHAFHES